MAVLSSKITGIRGISSSAGELPIEEQPRVVLLGSPHRPHPAISRALHHVAVVSRRRSNARPGEATASHQRGRHSEDPRLLRAVEVQTTCVIPGLHSQGDRRRIEHQRGIALRESQIGPAIGRIPIGIDRLIALGNQSEAAVSAVQIGSLLRRVDLESDSRRRSGTRRRPPSPMVSVLRPGWRDALRTANRKRFPRPAATAGPVRPAARRDRTRTITAVNTSIPAVKNAPAWASWPSRTATSPSRRATPSKLQNRTIVKRCRGRFPTLSSDVSPASSRRGVIRPTRRDDHDDGATGDHQSARVTHHEARR